MSAGSVSRAWSIFCIMCAANLLSSLQQVGLATVSNDVAMSFQADAATLGLLSAAFFYTYSAMQIPAGVLVDTVGSRKSVSIALVCAAVGTFIFAQAQTVPLAILGRVLTGLGLCMICVPLMKLTAVWFPAKDFGKMTAISFVVGSVGYWAATYPVAWLSALAGWRMPFTAIAIALAILALLVWIVVRDAPGTQNPVPGIGRKEIFSQIPGMLRKIACNRQEWLLGFWYFLQGGVYFSFVGLWGGQYLISVLGLDSTDAGWILSPAAGALITAPCFTWMASAMSRRAVLVILPCFSVILALPFVFGWSAEWGKPALCLYFFALAVASIGGAAVVFDAARAIFPVGMSGTVCGFINMFPLVGGALMQQAMGVALELLENNGFSQLAAFELAFTIYLACAIVAIVLGLNYIDALEQQDDVCGKQQLSTAAPDQIE